MTAAGIAFIAGGIATLICLRSVLFGRDRAPGRPEGRSRRAGGRGTRSGRGAGQGSGQPRRAVAQSAGGARQSGAMQSGAKQSGGRQSGGRQPGGEGRQLAGADRPSVGGAKSLDGRDQQVEGRVRRAEGAERPGRSTERTRRRPSLSELVDTTELHLPFARRHSRDQANRPDTPRQSRRHASRADDLPGGLASIGLADEENDEDPLNDEHFGETPPDDQGVSGPSPALNDGFGADSLVDAAEEIGVPGDEGFDVDQPDVAGAESGAPPLGAAADEMDPVESSSEEIDPEETDPEPAEPEPLPTTIGVAAFSPIRAALTEPEPETPSEVRPGEEESRPISVRRVDRSDRTYGDRVDGWIRPEYHEDPVAPPSGEYWTPVPLEDLGIDLPEDDPEPSARGYGWPIPVERLPAVPDYEPATGFDLAPVASEPTELVPAWPPIPGDRAEMPRSWASRDTMPAGNRFLENEPRGGRPEDAGQRFRAPTGEPGRRRPRPRPRPSAAPDNVYVSRHAADPPH